MSTLRFAMQAPASDVSLQWDVPSGVSVKVAHVPNTIPPVFVGDRLIIYALLSGVNINIFYLDS